MSFEFHRLKILLPLFLFFLLTFPAPHLHAQDSLRPKRTFNPTFHSKVKDHQMKHSFVIGPSVNTGFDKYFSAGAGLHVNWTRTKPGGRMGHWRHYNFMFDYKWNYYFTSDLLLRNDFSVGFFKVYSGFGGRGPWLYGELRLSRFTDRETSELHFAPLIGITQWGVLELKAGYRFCVRNEDERLLNDGVVVELMCRPFMTFHPWNRGRGHKHVRNWT